MLVIYWGCNPEDFFIIYRVDFFKTCCLICITYSLGFVQSFPRDLGNQAFRSVSQSHSTRSSRNRS